MVEYLPKWYKIDELMKIVQFIGVNRPDYKLKTEYPVNFSITRNSCIFFVSEKN